MLPGYRYIRWQGSRYGLSIRFAARLTPPIRDLNFDVSALPAPRNRRCTSAKAMKTYRINGVTVFWSATFENQEAWRCTGRAVIVAGESIPGADRPSRHTYEVARVVASARRIR